MIGTQPAGDVPIKYATPIATLLALALAACEGPEPQTAGTSAAPTTEAQDQSAPIPSASERPSAGVKTIPAPEKPILDCGARKLDKYLNLEPSDDVVGKIRDTVGHDHIRIIRPGDSVTMDYLQDRLNIEVGSHGKINYFRCG